MNSLFSARGEVIVRFRKPKRNLGPVGTGTEIQLQGWEIELLHKYRERLSTVSSSWAADRGGGEIQWKCRWGVYSAPPPWGNAKVRKKVGGNSIGG